MVSNLEKKEKLINETQNNLSICEKTILDLLNTEKILQEKEKSISQTEKEITKLEIKKNELVQSFTTLISLKENKNELEKTNLQIKQETEKAKTTKEEIQQIKNFLEENKSKVEQKEIDSIKSGISKKYKYSLENFIVFPELLELCKHKNLRWDDEDLETWLIIPKEKATSYMILENAIILSKLKANNLPDGWYTWFHNVPDESCSVIEKNEVAAIDIHYDGKGKYHLELFIRDGTPKESKIKIEQVSKKLSGTLTGSRYFFNDLTNTKDSNVVKKILEIIKEIES